MAKPKRRKASLHSAGKVTEQDLLERARELAADPALAMPICDGPCTLFSPVKAAQRAIPKIAAQAEDEAALTRAAGRGNELARAYAAVLLLAKADKIPYVADLQLGGDKIPYVVRGGAKPMYAAGLQHYDDRALRLLSYASWARKRGMHFYSADRGVVCTAKRAAPPADFIAEEADLLGLSGADGRFACGHEGDGVRLTWVASGVVFERCEACAKDESTLAQTMKHIASPTPSRHFGVEPRLAPLEARAGTLPTIPTGVPDEVAAAYAAGRISDAAYLQAARHARVEALRRSGAAHFVAGNVSYGNDVDAFLRALAPSPDEERALRAALAAHPGAVVLDRASLARAVAELWPDHGMRMLAAVSDEEAAKALHREKPAPDEAVELVRKAARQGASRAALHGLPTYAPLPPAAGAADAVARAYRGQGREAAVRLAQERANVAKAKGAALAMLTALQARQGQDWRFTQSDRDVADTLAEPVATLLTGPAERYHDALVEVSRSSGETAEIRRA
ncbi:MAG TPA: hypothetical protein VM370_05275 [Candidatus Thermoplasmatota archaeon]|nr:hypothetical protein [Candidatus Thermoplasmatota archaeon]